METKYSPTPRPLIPPIPAIPPGSFPGLESLYKACRQIYPDQPNPLQVTAVVKFWLGGPDPLDYVSMYLNPGNPDLQVEPHWHYISFGLSDLHGDGRVHQVSGPDTPSGFGFELTFRLKKEPQETAPPTWPAALMQALAKYVFLSENSLFPGDHVSWHCPLDNSESRIQHMLMTEDPQLGTVTTPFGTVTFIQVVGVCEEELRAAQGWNGQGVLELLKAVTGAGGPWAVTDMRRGESVFDLDPDCQEAVDHGVRTEGSNLSGVSARCLWDDHPLAETDLTKQDPEGNSSSSNINNNNSGANNNSGGGTPKKGLLKKILPTAIKKEKECKESSALLLPELQPVRVLEAVHLQFNLEAGTLLPLALKGRLKHGRHFTFKSVAGDVAITLVTPAVAGTFVSRERPYSAHGPWLQVLLEEDFLDTILDDLAELSHPDYLELPKTYRWPDKSLTLTLLPEEY